MLKIKHIQTFSMIVYNEKRTWWTQKNFITNFHCKCNFGVVKMSIRNSSRLGFISNSGLETNESDKCKL
jgi:protein associated with RNAse G/E